MLKKIWSLRVNNYWPELCEISIPLIEYWADKNGWKFETISERLWPEMPVTFEKLQVGEKGKDASHNLLLDLDILLRPDFYDPSLFLDPAFVASSYGFQASIMFKIDKYFARDQRNIGIVGNCVYTTALTHDLWEIPTDLSHEQILNSTRRHHIVDEFVISRNLAKYGLKYSGVSNNPDDYLVHMGCEVLGEEEKKKKVQEAWNIIDNWSICFPDIAKLF
jgi:hypothetical protein